MSRKEQIEQMLANDPDNAEWRYMLAMEHVSAEDHANALLCLEQILQGSPDYVPAYHQAGRILAQLGRIDEAKAILQRGIPVAQQKGDLHAAGEMGEFVESLE